MDRKWRYSWNSWMYCWKWRKHEKQQHRHRHHLPCSSSSSSSGNSIAIVVSKYHEILRNITKYYQILHPPYEGGSKTQYCHRRQRQRHQGSIWQPPPPKQKLFLLQYLGRPSSIKSLSFTLINGTSGFLWSFCQQINVCDDVWKNEKQCNQNLLTFLVSLVIFDWPCQNYLSYKFCTWKINYYYAGIHYYSF